jgi:PAS domain S-box-containing protein
VDILVESIFDTLPSVEGCWVGLEDRRSNRLLTVNARGYTHPESLLQIAAEIDGHSLPAQVFNSGKAQRIGELDFAKAYPMNQDELLKYREATGGMLPISTMVVPITLGLTTMGVIVLDNFHDVNAFSEDDQAILNSMGQQTALVLENSELYQQALHRAEQLQALTSAVQEVTSAPLRSDEMLERILVQTRLVVEADRIAVWLVREGQMVCRKTDPSGEPAWAGQSISLTVPDHSLRTTADLFDYTYLPRTIPADPRFNVGLFSDLYQTHLLVPLAARSELLGVLVLEHRQSDALSGGESQVVQAYASQAAVSLHNALMYEDSMRRAQDLNLQSDRLAGLNEFALQIGGMTNLEQIYEVTLQNASRLLNAPVISFVQVSRFDHMMLIAQKPEYDLSFTEDLADVPLMAGLRQSRAAYVIADTRMREDLGVLKDAYLSPLGTRSLLVVPVVAASQFWGWMWVQSPEVNAFDEHSSEIARMVANHVAIAIVNATNYYETRVMRENLEQRVAERTLELERGLEEYEMLNNNLQAILSSMADGVLVTNDHGKVVLTNPAAAGILHLEPGFLLGMDAGQLSEQLHAGDGIDWFRRLAVWSGENPPDSEAGIYSQRVEQEDGHILFIQGSTVLRDEMFLGSVTILRDITAEAMAERLKSEFVTNVSHELRTPITAIKGAVEVVLGQMTGNLNQQQEMFMTMARKNCDRLQVLIDDILEVSQIDAGQMELNFQMMDVAEVVTDTITDFERRSRLENRNMQFDVDLPGVLPRVEGDPQRVRQILDNLFSNAFRYTENGGRVITRVRQRGDSLQLDVEDNGIGIPPEAASRVFERFYRGEDELVMQSAGPGLGLWITKTLVEMHGGEIWFASSGIPGEGTTFSFTLPVRREGIAHG